MTAIAVVFLVIAVLIIWGGLIASTVALSKRPEIAEYPAGGEDAEAADRSGTHP